MSNQPPLPISDSRHHLSVSSLPPGALSPTTPGYHTPPPLPPPRPYATNVSGNNTSHVTNDFGIDNWQPHRSQSSSLNHRPLPQPDSISRRALPQPPIQTNETPRLPTRPGRALPTPPGTSHALGESSRPLPTPSYSHPTIRTTPPTMRITPSTMSSMPQPTTQNVSAIQTLRVMQSDNGQDVLFESPSSLGSHYQPLMTSGHSSVASSSNATPSSSSHPSRSTSQSYRRDAGYSTITPRTSLSSQGPSEHRNYNSLRPHPFISDTEESSRSNQLGSDRDRPAGMSLEFDPSLRSFNSAYDGLPETPKAMPMRTLDHQRSFMGESSRNGSSQDHLTQVIQPPGSRALVDFPSPRPTHRDSRQNIPERQQSAASSLHPPSSLSSARRSTELSPSWAEQPQPPSRWVQNKLLLHQSGGGYGDSYEQDSYDDWDGVSDDEEEEEEEEVNEIRFFNPAFLSEAALQLRDRVIRGRHVKAGIAWVGTFTGRDLVSTIQTFLPPFTRETPSDRRFALITARSLQSQLWVIEVDWDDKPIRDSSEVVFKFMGEMEGMGDALNGGLPSGVMTMATKCYSPSCMGDGKCYSPRCPYRTSPSKFLGGTDEEGPSQSATLQEREKHWTQEVDPMLLGELSEDQHNRQTIIRQAIAAEEQYEADLAALEQIFIMPLLTADPPIIYPARNLDIFANELFSNVPKLRQACRRLIDNFSIRLREQAPLIRTVGDIFLEAATDLRSLYPVYTGNLPHADSVLNQTLEENPQFRLFVERVSRGRDRRWDLRHLLKRPATHLQRYPAVLEAILKATSPNDPDYDFLSEALSSIQNISAISQLKLFHASKGRGPAANLKWYDLVSEEVRESMDKKEFKRQMHIWELIQGEMEYVSDLEVLETVFITGLREAEKPIIERARFENFVDDVFHNYRSLLEVHSRLLEDLQERQIEQHPRFGMVSDLILNAALNWNEVYMEYIPHYPIARAKIEEEKIRTPAFAAFLEDCMKNPASHRHDIFHFIHRPIGRLLRYELLLKDILAALKATGPENHPDIDTIPQILDLIYSLGKATEKGVAVNEAKVELWQFQHSLDGGKFGPRSVKDLDLLNPMRELIHKGKVYRQPEGTIGGAWSELYLLLFDHYFVLVKQTKLSSKNREGPARYSINRRPIPLELFSLGSFSDPAQTRSLGLLKTFRGAGASHEPDSQAPAQSDSRTVYPFTFSFIGQGQLGGQYTLWTDSATARQTWHEKLQHAKVLRTEVNDAGKVFEMTPLSQDTFFMAPGYGVTRNEDDYTGRVTCSAPFVTVDGRSLVAVGCQEGVWIGVRHDPKSLRKVLHVRGVTQIAVLEEFGIFLVLADKSLLAYHLEALVPTAASPQVRSAPQRLSGVRDIVFFAVGQISGRTLVLYMKRKGIDSVFRVLEPILNRGIEDTRQRRPFGSLLGQRTEWFRVYKDFFIPTEALHVHFLKAKLAIVCAKGFEIMDLTDLKGGSIPIFDPVKARDRPALAELARRCEGAKPLAMFRSTESEFLLCYDAFGVYVDRHGEPNRDHQAIEWEGRPDSVTFHPPYLLLISPSFIEVRHIDNAKLLQIYTGSDIRCTWDGTGGMSKQPNDTPGPKGWGDETSSQEPRIHICQRPDDPRRTKGIGQHVFELTPTLLLNNPLLNPIHTQDSNYFPPAPLNHRASSITTVSSSGGYGYGYYSHDTSPGSGANGYSNVPGYSNGSMGANQSANVNAAAYSAHTGQSGYVPQRNQQW